MRYEGLSCVNFNQDYTCISAGTKTGFRIYNCDPFGRCYIKGESHKMPLITRKWWSIHC